MSEFKKALSKSQVGPGCGTAVQVNEHKIAVFNVNGAFYAIDNTCLHRGGPLAEGDLSGATVTCPWHAWEFDVTTGCLVGDPNSKVKTYEVKVEGEDLLVKI